MPHRRVDPWSRDCRQPLPSDYPIAKDLKLPAEKVFATSRRFRSTGRTAPTPLVLT